MKKVLFLLILLCIKIKSQDKNFYILLDYKYKHWLKTKKEKNYLKIGILFNDKDLAYAKKFNKTYQFNEINTYYYFHSYKYKIRTNINNLKIYTIKDIRENEKLKNTLLGYNNYKIFFIEKVNNKYYFWYSYPIHEE